MKKRVAACMTAACLAATTVGMAVGLTGCGGKGPKFPTKDSDPNANLSVLLLANTAEREFYNPYFEEMAEKYGIKITFEGYEESDYYSRLDSLMQQGNVPDIFYVRPNEILQYKDAIFCLDQFKDTVAENENLNLDLNDIYPLALDLYKYNEKTNSMDEKDGELYAFPKDLSTQQLGYYKPIVEQYATQIHNADLKLPWEMDFKTENYTWAQYREMCEIIATEANKQGNEHYASDIPDIEILAKSFGGGILDTKNMKVTVQTEAVKKAIAYQESLVKPSNENRKAAADYTGATQDNFIKKKVAFYGAIGSWEVGDYDKQLGKGNWDIMPWPTEDGSTNWYGKITSAGYVVSNKCKNWQAAMEIAASFMTTKVQTNMMQLKVSIPMNVKLQNAYVDPTNDYSPATRSVFIDVIKGTSHSFRPAKYYTYQDGWQKSLTDELQKLWTGRSYLINDATQNDMQLLLDGYKKKY